MKQSTQYPPAYPHGDIIEIYQGVYVVYGSVRMGLGMWMNRNMVILQHNQDLSLINPVRIDDNALERLDELGQVKHIIRLGDFHGMDDAFYLERYDCKFWAQIGQDTYPNTKVDATIDSTTQPPIPHTDFFIFETAIFPEAAMLLKEHELLITTDSVQYYEDWHYFSCFTKLVFKWFFKFKLGINIGGPWIQRVTPKNSSMQRDFEKLLMLNFDAIIAAHGSHLKSGAKNLLTEEVKKMFSPT